MEQIAESTQPIDETSFEHVLEARFGRRGALKAAIAGATGAAIAATIAEPAAAAGPYALGELTYDAVTLSDADAITLPAGFTYDVLISWGDPVVPGAPAFDILNQSEAAQAQQCGFNHDYLDFRPLPYGSTNSAEGLLWVNHEYTDSTMMFENYTSTASQVNTEMAAHGGTVVRVLRATNGSWSYDPTSSYNRRITAKTPMTLTGPVAGDARVKTNADPAGTTVLGMLNNCGGGNTPWGTIMTCEENFDQYFGNYGNMPAGYSKTVIAESYGSFATASARKWETVHPRFDLAAEPNEQLRFGWIVEIDPYDPTYVPKKRTAMGRFKHEAAAGTVAPSGKFVSYSGDDQVNNYIYKFVTNGVVNTSNRAANEGLLDDGTLYVAKFNADGSGTWMPITFGTGPLVAPTFDGQADVLLRTRRAATLLGATKMARPEDVEVNPVTKKVYAVMTGNSGAEVNAANPRTGGSSISNQGLGHVIEITEAGGDNAALTFTWEMFLLCGYPNATGSVATNSSPLPALASATADNSSWWAGYDETKVSPIARVDNVSFDSKGNMYLSSDGQPSALQTGLKPLNDGVWGFPTDGAERGHGKALACTVRGCEATGPFFTPDDRTLFLAIQHPGVDMFTWTSATAAPTASVGNFATPGSAWNTTPAIPGKTPGVPRAAAIAIRRLDNTEVGYGVSLPPDIPEFPLPVVAIGSAAALGGLVLWRQHRMNNSAPA